MTLFKLLTQLRNIETQIQVFKVHLYFTVQALLLVPALNKDVTCKVINLWQDVFKRQLLDLLTMAL